MTKEEYKIEMNQIEKRFDAEKKELYKRYAFANNPYKVGDIITDHIGSIQIQKIQTYVSLSYPECVYTGIELNKDGNPSKKQRHITIYQSNIIK